jgi:GNAT superfamily N-acetyltransferase
MSEIQYLMERSISAAQLADVFQRSGISRPVEDLERMGKMLAHANLLITAWDGDMLVGVARGLSDFSFCCYLSDLAVDAAYQTKGIGGELLRMTRELIGPQASLLLLAAPSAMPYYPKQGFNSVSNGWIIPRAA